MDLKNIAVIGSGAWGTALATVAAKAASNVLLWARNSELVSAINNSHENSIYLPNITIPANIRATAELREIISAELIIIAVPAQILRSICMQLKELKLSNKTPLIICSKGIEEGSLLLMSEVVKEVLPEQSIINLSGPNFAHEIAMGKPSATVLASSDINLAEEIARKLSNAAFRIYFSDDIIGTQISGAVKNVLAIACGIVIGKELGENAKAALITRGIAEIKRLCLAKGGKTETLLGLSGVGDIILTCNSLKSRNTSLGLGLAQGKKINAILKERHAVTEGVYSCRAVVQLAAKLKLEMPICDAINKIIYHDATIESTINEILARPIGNE